MSIATKRHLQNNWNYCFYYNFLLLISRAIKRSSLGAWLLPAPCASQIFFWQLTQFPSVFTPDVSTTLRHLSGFGASTIIAREKEWEREGAETWLESRPFLFHLLFAAFFSHWTGLFTSCAASSFAITYFALHNTLHDVFFWYFSRFEQLANFLLLLSYHFIKSQEECAALKSLL